ncbi:MAG: ribosomal protein S18-alanine N-acetyltransferase [Acidobacteria bacterium]|nr:ribosomal protein S18-alanine N-acetyltransferase [Acidobacteriota bacterium]
MRNSIVIRPVEAVSRNTLKQLLKIEHACFPDPWSPAMFTVSGTEGIILAENPDGTAVGFACFQYFLNECHILNIAVLPEFRKQGIGQQLMEWMLTELKNAQEFYLEVRENNRAAISLYQALGFQPIGKRRSYYQDGETAIVMHKKKKPELFGQ